MTHSEIGIGVMVFATASTMSLPRLGRHVESLGFESLFLPEHPVIPQTFATDYPAGGPLPDEYRQMLDPFVGLACVASATSTLKLGTAISLALERNPLLMAKTVATLDQVSNGRVVLGIGSGWLEEEGQIFGVDWKRRGSQLRDHVSAMKRCWIDEESSYEGEFYHFPKLINKPKPVQRPHPPILLAGEMAVVAKRAARWANGWIPRYVWSSEESIREGRERISAAFVAEGRDPNEIDITLFGMRANRDEILQWQDAGCTRVLFVLPPSAEADVLSRLDHIATRVLG